jgi:hypothetical protein
VTVWTSARPALVATDLAAPGPSPADEPAGPSSPGQLRRRSLQPLALGFAAYLVLSVLAWWGVWSSHPTATASCGCGDTSLFVWFLEWPAYALAHGHSLFFSTAMLHPTGINLLSNTSVLSIGFVLAPVTWAFGPVATLNVASTLCPALSALAMMWLVRRWVSWTPAAFIAGLMYGFSPMVLGSLAVSHLMDAMLVVPPLVVGCLDELLVRQRRRPVPVGVVLALLVVVQFFLSTELLAIMAAIGVVALVVLGGYALVVDRAGLRRRLSRAWPGVGAAGAISVVLLAYPVWFALAGPAHLSGLVWPNVPAVSNSGTTPDSLMRVTPTPPGVLSYQHLMGGFLGGALPNTEFLGIGLVGVLLAGVIVWRRDRRLWFFAVLGVASAVLSFRTSKSFWVPWRALSRIPVIQNVLPQRFSITTMLCAAVLLGIIVDRAHALVLSGAGMRAGPSAAPGAVRHRRRSSPGVVRSLVAGVVALVVAAVALVPIGRALAGILPITVVPVVVPSWFANASPHLPDGQVVLTYPAPFSGVQSALGWQAIEGMPFAQNGGGGPAGIAFRAGSERPGYEVIWAATGIFGPVPKATPAELTAVRRALTGWGTTMVVIPNQAGLPLFQQGHATSFAVGLFTAALGTPPRYQAGAWVWTDVQRPHPSLTVSSAALQACAGSANYRSGPPETVPDCVLAASGR